MPDFMEGYGAQERCHAALSFALTDRFCLPALCQCGMRWLLESGASQERIRTQESRPISHFLTWIGGKLCPPPVMFRNVPHFGAL
jgi:hypothetical protein